MTAMHSPHTVQQPHTVQRLFGGDSLWVQMLQLAWRDLTLGNKRVDLALLEANNSTKPIRGQLTFVDEPVERAGRESQRGGRFFSGQPIAVCRCHRQQYNTLSMLLTTFRLSSGGRS